PLTNKQLSEHGKGYFASLPWGSIATVGDGRESLALMTGPLKFEDGVWFLKVLESADSADELEQAVRQFRKEAGLNPRRSKETPNLKGRQRPVVSGISHAISNRPPSIEQE